MQELTPDAVERFEQLSEELDKHFIPRFSEETCYLVSEDYGRSYGGPEEGGWWYDWSEVVAAIEINGQQELADSFCLLFDRYGMFRSYYDRLSGRRIVLSKSWPEKRTPKSKPRYE